MEPGSNPLKEEQMIADGVKLMQASQGLPEGFYQRADGLVSPERLKNPEPEITVNGMVNQEMFRNLSNTLQGISETNKIISGLRVNFSSFGGEVTPGFGVHDLLSVFAREKKAPVVITGYGPIMSMGVLILQAGDVRRMPQNSRMLLHPLSGAVSGNVSSLEHQVQESKVRYSMYTQIVSDRVRRAGKEMSPEDVKNLMEANAGEGTFLTSQEALNLGLIDEVV